MANPVPPHSIEEALALSNARRAGQNTIFTPALAPEYVQQLQEKALADYMPTRPATAMPIPDRGIMAPDANNPRQSWVAKTPTADEEALQDPLLGMDVPGPGWLSGKLGSVLASKGAVGAAAAAGGLAGIVRNGINASDGITIQKLSPSAQADHWDKATHRFWANDNFAPEMDGKRHGMQGWINQDKKTAYLEVIDIVPNFRFAGVGDEASLALATRLDAMGIKTLNLNSLPGKEEFYMKMGGKPDPFGDFHGMKEFHLNVKDMRKVLEGKNLTQKYPEANRPWRSLDEIATIEKTLKDKAAVKAAQEKGK